MKDQETLASHNVKDGMTVHLVIKQGGAAAAPPAAAAPSQLLPPHHLQVARRLLTRHSLRLAW